MRWRSPEEFPRNGQIVAVLYRHWKEVMPTSYQVMFGKVQHSNDGASWFADSNDDTGQGSWGTYHDSNMSSDYHDKALAWMPAEEFIFPTWVAPKPSNGCGRS